MLTDLPLVGLTAPGVLLFAVILLLTGHIVPRKHLKDKETEILRWKQAYETEREARMVSDNQTSKLLVGIEVNRDLMIAFMKIVKPEAASGGPSDEAAKG